jgi:putative FmdB family regulatory protein
MPLYEFRCRTCDEAFEVRRPMSQANDPATCPAGHPDSVRLLSVFASVGAPSGNAPAPAATPRMGGGCGSGCGCAH